MILKNEGEKKVYCDTEELEKEMLDIASSWEKDEIDERISKDNRYTVNNTFSSVRRNLLNWYSFDADSSVLEVGAGMGALTGLLCEKCKHVTALEMSSSRAEVIKARNRNADNLTVVCEDIFSWATDEKFDYIVVIGVLEYAAIFAAGEENPFLKFVNRLNYFLKNEGVVLLAIENRFGLKYWCGASEDHLCVPFKGIEGYKEPNTAKTFSKAELQNIFRSSGFQKQRMYYVLPDYKFPTCIFTDEHTLDATSAQKVVYQYVKGSTLCCDEKDLYEDIIKNGVQDFFANSFLIEAKKNNDLDDNQPIFIQSRGECKRKYRTSTLFFRDNKVVKCAMHPDAKSHLNDIQRNEAEIRKQGIDIIRTQMTERGLEMDFYHGTTGEEVFHGLLCQDKENDILNLIQMLKDQLSASSEVDNDNLYSNSINDSLKTSNNYGSVLVNGYIDMNFSNCFINNNNFLFFDQEWKINRVPINFILYYAINHVFLNFSGTTKVSKNDIFVKIGIGNYLEDFGRFEKFVWDQIMYRQEHLYDGDGWYNEYSENNKIDVFLERYSVLDAEVQEKNNYILQCEDKLKKLVDDMKEKDAYYECEFVKKNSYIEECEQKIKLLEENSRKKKQFFRRKKCIDMLRQKNG